jgi:hypothetical protein
LPSYHAFTSLKYSYTNGVLDRYKVLRKAHATVAARSTPVQELSATEVSLLSALTNTPSEPHNSQRSHIYYPPFQSPWVPFLCTLQLKSSILHSSNFTFLYESPWGVIFQWLNRDSSLLHLIFLAPLSNFWIFERVLIVGDCILQGSRRGRWRQFDLQQVVPDVCGCQQWGAESNYQAHGRGTQRVTSHSLPVCFCACDKYKNAILES